MTIKGQMKSLKWKRYPKILINYIQKDMDRHMKTYYTQTWINAKWGLYYRALEILFTGATVQLFFLIVIFKSKIGGIFRKLSHEMVCKVQYLGSLVNTKVCIFRMKQRRCGCGCHRFYNFYSTMKTCHCNKYIVRCVEGFVPVRSIEVGIPKVSVHVASMILRRYKIPKDLRLIIVKNVFDKKI